MLSFYILYYSLFLIIEIIILRINNFRLVLKTRIKNNIEPFHLRINHIIFLILIFFFYGWRNIYFGSDFNGYVEEYKLITNDLYYLDYFFKHYEMLSYYSVYLFTYLHIPYQVYYGLLATVPYYFILRSANDFKYLIPFVIYFVFVGNYFDFSHSAVRQSVAIGIFLYSIQFIYKNNFKKFFLWVIIGSLFHISLIVFLPIYFLKYLNYKRWIAFLLFFISSINIIKDYFYKFFLYIIGIILNDFLPMYEHYLHSSKILISSHHYGIGMFIYDLARLWLIYMSKKVLFFQPKLKIYFILAVIDIFLIKMFWNIEVFARYIQYFEVCFYFAFAAVIYYSTTKYEKMISYGFILLYFINYIAGIQNLYRYMEGKL